MITAYLTVPPCKGVLALGALLPPNQRFMPHIEATPPKNATLMEMTVSIKSKDTSSLRRWAKCKVASDSVASVRSFKLNKRLRA